MCHMDREKLLLCHLLRIFFTITMSESLKNILQPLECPLLWYSSYWMLAAPSNPGSFLLIACYLVSLHHFETHELRRKSSFIFLHRILFPDLSPSPLPGKKRQESKLHFLLKYEPVSTSVDFSLLHPCALWCTNLEQE